jgi:hypothetical protein
MQSLSATPQPAKDKKDFRRTVTARLQTALADLQNGSKEKKFKSAIKRAGKLLANDLYSKAKKDKKKKDKEPAETPEIVGA